MQPWRRAGGPDRLRGRLHAAGTHGPGRLQSTDHTRVPVSREVARLSRSRLLSYLATVDFRTVARDQCEGGLITAIRAVLGLAAAMLLAATPTAASGRIPGGDPCWLSSSLAVNPALERRIAELGGLRAPESLFALRGDLPEPVSCAGARAADRLGWVAGRFELAFAPVASRAVVNSAYPRGRNDGVLWAGAGVSAVAAGGVTLRWGPLSAALRPIAAYQQNADFETVHVELEGYSRFIYPNWRGYVDLPQRFGDSSFHTLHPGQSFVRIEGLGLRAGFSTEDLWWGPALVNPIVMSSSAPGFPHVFLGTARPLGVGIGRVEAELLWGRLTESGYFDGDAGNDERLLAGLVLAFQPRGITGLALGMSRAFHMYMAPELTWLDYLLVPYTDVRDNPLSHEDPLADNQILSFFARWVHPASGFELWGEWAREDHWTDLRELFFRPEAASAYMLGFQKLFGTPRRGVRLYGELTHLGDALPILHAGRGVLVYYTHSQIRQGHTHAGQVLGASIGPGSDAQILGIERLAPGRRTELFVERVRYDDDAYQARWVQYFAGRGHDVERTVGVRHLQQVGSFDLSAGLLHSRRWNRNFLGLPELAGRHVGPQEFRSESNWSLEFGSRWLPGRTTAGRRSAATQHAPQHLAIPAIERGRP
jgi:hypothetical protein